MSDIASVALAQRTFWNSEVTRRWVTEQTRIDRLMAEVTDAALAAAAPVRGERVLDIGCGTGTTVLRLAEAVGPSGRVLGVDISDQQLGLARQRVVAAGATDAQLVLDDTATHRFSPETVDLGFSRFGVMFFADPVAAFGNIRHGIKNPPDPRRIAPTELARFVRPQWCGRRHEMMDRRCGSGCPWVFCS